MVSKFDTYGRAIFLAVIIILVSFFAIFFPILGHVDSVIRHDVPKFHVNDITLTEFTLSPTNDTLYFDLAVNVTFSNPSNRVKIHFDKYKAILSYHGNKLMTREFDRGFYLRHKEENNNVTAVFRGERLFVLYVGDERVMYESERKDGVYDIELKFIYKKRTRFWSTTSEKYTCKVVWDLKVLLGVPNTKFEITKYYNDDYADWDKET